MVNDPTLPDVAEVDPEGNGQKDVSEEAIAGTVRAVPKQTGVEPKDLSFSDTLVWFVAQAADEFMQWGTRVKVRDKQLRAFIGQEPHSTSALGIVAARNAAFNWQIEGPSLTATRSQQVLEEANDGRGWEDFVSKITQDLSTQDTGAFIEVVRQDKSDPRSPLIGINSMDAARCYHTGDPLKPVIYQDQKSAYHLLNWWQVVPLAEMPVSIEGLYGLQFCAFTRLLMAAQIMRNIQVYKKEKTGGRNTRAVHLVQGLTTKQINDAMAGLQARADTSGQSHYVQPAVIGSHDPQAKLDVKTLELATLPDGFREDEATRLYLTIISMAFMSDYQEFAPLPGGNLGTSMQSQILHMKSRGKGPGLFMKIIRRAMNQRILPKTVTFQWEEQDLEAEELEAKIRKVRAEERQIRIDSAEIDQPTARVLALETGDLSQELFDELEAQAEEQEAAPVTTQQARTEEGEGERPAGGRFSAEEGEGVKEDDEGEDAKVPIDIRPFGLTVAAGTIGMRQMMAGEPERAGPFEDDRISAEAKLTDSLERFLKRTFAKVKQRLRQESQQTQGFRSKAMGDIVNDEFFWGARKDEFMRAIGDQPEGLLLEGGTQAQALGLAVDFERVNQDVLNFARTYKNRWWSQLDRVTRRALRTAIATHIETGEPLRVLNKRLEPVFGRVRAEMVARTEVTRMYAEGNRMGYADAGVQYVRWRTVRDAKVDPICEELHDKVMKLGEEENVPPAHPRCRCWLAPTMGPDKKPVTKPVEG